MTLPDELIQASFGWVCTQTLSPFCNGRTTILPPVLGSGTLPARLSLTGFPLNIRRVDKRAFAGTWIEKKNAYVPASGVVNIPFLALYPEPWLTRTFLKTTIWLLLFMCCEDWPLNWVLNAIFFEVSKTN